MSARAVRGACPSLSAPMVSGDGLIARLHPAGGISPTQLKALCEAATALGNGLLEVTQRGNLQFRGLTAESALQLPDAVNEIGITADEGLPIDMSPLAGLDPAEVDNPRPLAAALRKKLSAMDLALAPKLSVVIDVGGAISVAALRADIRIEACAPGRWLVSAAGDGADPRRLGVGDAGAAVTTALGLIERIASLGPKARARDLDATTIVDMSRGLERSACTPSHTGGQAIGRWALGDGRIALGFGLPFGVAAGDLASLAGAAEALGCAELRLAPGRAMIALLPEAGTASLSAAAATLGFVTEADDPRSHVAACAGRPACASGSIAARAIAPAVAAAARDLLDGSMTIHVSGCTKGCAHPGVAALTIVGDANGAAIVVGGTASGSAAAHLAEDAVVSAVRQIADRVCVAARPGETSAETVRRVGIARVASQRTPTAA